MEGWEWFLAGLGSGFVGPIILAMTAAIYVKRNPQVIVRMMMRRGNKSKRASNRAA